MSTNPANLTVIDEKVPDPETVEMLEKVLAKARTGEVRMVMIVCIKPDHTFSTGYSDKLTLQDAVFGAALLQERVQRMLAAAPEKDDS